MAKPYVQIGARLDLETARKLDELIAVHGTTVAVLTAAIHHLHAATKPAGAVDTGTRSNRRYGQTPEERETLARILELDASGARKSEIVKTLNAEQRYTRSRTDWTIPRLATILNTAKERTE